MNIVVLAGGLSTERDVSLVTGNMVSRALRKNGHNVILLDVFMGYSDKEENVTDLFARSEEVSLTVEGIPTTEPDLAAVKASRPDQSDNFFGPNVIAICQMADIVYMGLHGADGEIGKVQAAFDVLGMVAVNADTVIKNTRSQHVLEKVGFQYIKEENGFKYYRIVR